MLVVVTGGSGSGKSAFAEETVPNSPKRVARSSPVVAELIFATKIFTIKNIKKMIKHIEGYVELYF